ncbi:hypothetical protein QFZ58_000228 [Streptomyces sp. B1I3]|nr:hypothetical protein [Streptomyces sp. B1I3]
MRIRMQPTLSLSALPDAWEAVAPLSPRLPIPLQRCFPAEANFFTQEP